MNPGYVYLIGSLRNPRIPELAKQMRAAGIDAWDEWHAAGELADDSWQAYEADRGRSFVEALDGAHAQNVFHFDKDHLDGAAAVVLVLPAGKSGHLELGYAIGSGTPGFILLDGEPERLDVMYNFATAVFDDVAQLIDEIRPVQPLPMVEESAKATYRAQGWDWNFIGTQKARDDYLDFLAGRESRS